MAQPTRLSGISYDQLYVYFVTSVTLNRIKAFDRNDFGPFVASALIDIAARFGFEVSAYVVMEDHVHFLVTAIEMGADFKKMVAAWKQKTGFEWSRRHGRKLWQHGYWERVLRDNENALSVCRYIVENPVRAGLVAHPTAYPLCGSTQYEIRDICEAIQMKGWWSGF
jgi:REP element-mobilizing transposase RayT